MIGIDIKDLHLLKSIVAEDKDKIRVDGISWDEDYIDKNSPWKCVFSVWEEKVRYSIIEYDEERSNCPCDACDMNDNCRTEQKLACCDYCRFSKHDHCETCEL